MRPRFVILVFVVVALILALLFWLRPVKSTVTQKKEEVYVTNTSVLNKNLANQSVSINDTSLTNSRAISKSNPPITHRMTLEEVTKQFVESKNKPIDFYGLVIDQDSNALSGVHIKSSIEQLRVANPIEFEMGIGSKEIPIERMTGTDGRFEIHDVSGNGFGILLFKDGYEAESEKNGFGGGTSGSYENPIIFKMWSDKIHEHLVNGKNNFHIVPDGRPYFISLTNGAISESGTGDLKVWVKRPEQITYGKRYDWSCEVDVINGGLQVASDYAMYQAPSEGYIPSFQFEQAVGSGWGDSTGERRFYITFNNGQEYGHITVELYAYYNNQIPAMVSIQYAINPSGSRILR